MRPTLDATWTTSSLHAHLVVLLLSNFLAWRRILANKKLPPQARDESMAPAVPPFLSHLWPVTALGYLLRGYQPPHPTCSPRCGFLRRAAHGPVHRWGFSGFHHLPIRCKHPSRLLIPLIAGLRHLPLFDCVAKFSIHNEIMQPCFRISPSCDRKHEVRWWSTGLFRGKPRPGPATRHPRKAAG